MVILKNKSSEKLGLGYTDKILPLASLGGLGIGRCHELWCRLQMQLRSQVAVAVVQAGSCSSNSTPSLGTSICPGDPKKQKTKKKKKKEREREFCGDLQVKVLALSLLLWLRFDPWPQNFCMLQVIVMKKNFLKRSSHCGLTGSTAS